LIAKGTTKIFPIHFTNNPIFISPHNRKKYPDNRRILPMYLKKSDFAIRGDCFRPVLLKSIRDYFSLLLEFECIYIIPIKGTTVNPQPQRKRKKGLAASFSTI
jgi:hypothetical protein